MAKTQGKFSMYRKRKSLKNFLLKQILYPNACNGNKLLSLAFVHVPSHCFLGWRYLIRLLRGNDLPKSTKLLSCKAKT